MDRWEYCYADLSFHRVYYFTKEGLKSEKVRREKEVDETKDDAFARMVAIMGMDGWELVSGVGGGLLVTLFFKRKVSLPG